MVGDMLWGWMEVCEEEDEKAGEEHGRNEMMWRRSSGGRVVSVAFGEGGVDGVDVAES